MTLLYTMDRQIVKRHSKSHKGVTGNFGIIHKTVPPHLSEICAFDTFWNTIFALYMSQYAARGRYTAERDVFVRQGLTTSLCPCGFWADKGHAPEGVSPWQEPTTWTTHCQPPRRVTYKYSPKAHQRHTGTPETHKEAPKGIYTLRGLQGGYRSI